MACICVTSIDDKKPGTGSVLVLGAYMPRIHKTASVQPL
jgi:hypothetical protein